METSLAAYSIPNMLPAREFEFGGLLIYTVFLPGALALAVDVIIIVAAAVYRIKT